MTVNQAMPADLGWHVPIQLLCPAILNVYMCSVTEIKSIKAVWFVPCQLIKPVYTTAIIPLHTEKATTQH